MKSKQEVIQEAWGAYWPLVDGLIDENGWYSYFSFMSKDMKRKYHQFGDLEMQEAETLPLIRPKSLSGIENNNGWKRIESESDLPKEGMTNYMYCTDGKPSIHIVNLRMLINLYKDGVISHYMALPAPEAPIY